MVSYFGVRPTSDKLHLGHMMSMINMFNFIIKNRSSDEKFYILLAEIHAKISKVNSNIIRNNSISLANQITALFKAYLQSVNLPNDEVIKLLDKLVFILQDSDEISRYHQMLTYELFTLINVNTVLTNPIFNESDNSSVAFLLYPLLQTIDVLLYINENTTLNVFVSNDQKANINIAKDIIKKLNIDNSLVKFHIYDKVLYDNKNLNKMSKSLNNTVSISNDEVFTYLTKHKTFGRSSADAPGDFNQCPMFTNIGKDLQLMLPDEQFLFESCTSGTVGCFDCKNKVFECFKKIIDNYNLNLTENIILNFEDSVLASTNFNKIIKKIEGVRCK